MRILKYTLLSLSCCLTLCGCMQHHGNIGDWFGTWKLTSMELDGVEDPSYDGNIFFQFQADIVRIVEVDPQVSNTFNNCFGHWADNGSTLTLDFSYDATDKTDDFTPPSATMLIHGINILHIDKSDSKSMVWTYNPPDSDLTVTYRLKKQ